MSQTNDAPDSTGRISPSWFDTNVGSSTVPTPDQPGSTSAPPTTTQTMTPPAAAGSPDEPIDQSSLIGRTSIALIGVIGIILVCGWLLKRFGLQRNQAADRLKVISSRSLGQRERVVIMEIDDEWLVLGVTAHSINTLHRRPAPPTESDQSTTTAAASPGNRPTFGQALADNIGRLGRRDR